MTKKTYSVLNLIAVIGTFTLIIVRGELARLVSAWDIILEILIVVSLIGVGYTSGILRCFESNQGRRD